MKNKEQFLKKLSDILDKVEDKECEISYFAFDVSNYNFDNSKSERKLSYFQNEIKYNVDTLDFEIEDTSEPFICTMSYLDCEQRGYCNGDC